MKTIKVGFLGLGVVGSELVNIIRNNMDRIYVKYGIKLELGKIYVRDLDKKRSIDVTNLQLTTNAYDILDDKETAIVCECVGGAGTEGTREYIERAVKNGKSVVLSSKKVLALYGMFGNLRPGDELLSITGKPYDTLEEVIGIRGQGAGSLKEFGISYNQVDLMPDGSMQKYCKYQEPPAYRQDVCKSRIRPAADVQGPCSG